MEKVGDNCLLQKLNILYNLYAKERWDKKSKNSFYKKQKCFCMFLTQSFESLILQVLHKYQMPIHSILGQ